MSLEISSELREKLKKLPAKPGVYLHKNKKSEVIYIGKAAVLKNRVRHYFQKNQDRGIKNQSLVDNIATVDWIETDSEIDALFLESELVKRYMPKYNILLRDGKSHTYIRIDKKSQYPTVTTTRIPRDDGAEYFGPFFSGYEVRNALRYLRKVFPFFIKKPEGQISKLDYQIGLNPDISDGGQTYKQNLQKLIGYIKGNSKGLYREIEKEMKEFAKNEDFENAIKYRRRLTAMKQLQQKICFGDKEFLSISSDQALLDLRDIFGLKDSPHRIECYDISHMGGKNVVGSMVVFVNGASKRSEYRKFKTSKEVNDDFYNMHEVLHRRLSTKNVKNWILPSLMFIDGGKGQLDAAIRAKQERGIVDQPMLGIAKKEEQIIVDYNSSCTALNHDKIKTLGGWCEKSERFVTINLPKNSHVIKLIQRIRDESHRFAVSYHSVLKQKNQTKSELDDIVGIGPKTKKKLLNRFGSVNGVKKATHLQIKEVIGKAKADIIKSNLKKA